MGRRGFLIGMGAVGVAFALSPECLLGADVPVIPNAEGFLLVDMKKCQGCGTCMMMCSLAHTGEASYTLRVTKWGLRVAESVYRRVAADKKDDGIIQNNRFGAKRRGYLEPDYEIPTTGAALTQW